MNQARENSVKQLSELYNVVIGIALSLAMFNTVDKGATPLPIASTHALNLITFLVLIIPFYHGAVRHLYSTYIEDGGSTRILNGGVLADFILLFIEGCFFIMIASVISNVLTLIALIIGLLILDSVWGLLAWLAFTGANAQYAEKKWAIINTITASILTVGFMTGKEFIPAHVLETQVILLVIIFLRTLADYGFTWKFYFPPSTDKN